MDLLETFRTVDAMLDKLDFATLFSGFHRYRYALYTDSEICLDGEMLPYQVDFRGNTALEFNGECIAIWNMETDPAEDTELLAYGLVHEMYHCHQRANGEKRYPSELALLHYSGDIGNFEKKYNENLYLADAWEKNDVQALQKFTWIRNMRIGENPDMVQQELKIETVEGMAEYVGLKALQTINSEKFAAVTGGYLQKLRAQDGLVFDLRRICYYSGALYALCLDRHGKQIDNDFSCEQTVYEQNSWAVSADGSVVIRSYDFIPYQFTELTKERERLIAHSIRQWGYTACKAYICGFDPMNMFRVGDFVYCKNFVCLDTGGTVRTMNTSVVLRMNENSDQEIVGYYSAKQHR